MTPRLCRLIVCVALVTAVSACKWRQKASNAKSNAPSSGDVCDAEGPQPQLSGERALGPLKLVFCDSFDGTLLDQVKWSTNFGAGHLEDAVGKEHEVSFDYDAYYDEHLVSQAGGLVSLNATDEVSPDAVHGAKWTSSALTSRFKFMYGYVEIRMRAPDTHGFWPSLWMCFEPQWPPEVDIIEIRTNMKENGIYNFSASENYIWGPAWNDKQSNYLDLTRSDLEKAQLCDPDEVSCGKKLTSFNTYAVAWQPDKLTYFINGQKIHDAEVKGGIKQQIGYLIMNLGVGGWSEKPDGRTDWAKAHADIDWVRIWSFPETPTTFTTLPGADMIGFNAAAKPGAAEKLSPAPPPGPLTAPSPGQECPIASNSSGPQWCDCYAAGQCWPWCRTPTSGDWGYEPSLGGLNGSCHARPTP